jgi:ubiquinone/menaquinone biosynthesis C-methylase UbiE
MTLRQRCFQFYWKARGAIAPRLEDAQAVYEDRLRAHVRSSDRWLDIGCGHQVLQPWRGESERTLVEEANFVVGLDVEQDALKRHRSITKRVSGDLGALPFPDASFDLITASMVLEHLRDPATQLAEIQRVLAPGGVFLALTPNLLGYQALTARCIPGPLKRLLVRILQGRAEEDVFPTYYRINTDKTIARLATKTGFVAATVLFVSTEAQFIVVPPLVVVELMFLRALMSSPLRRLRPNLIAVLHKSGA